MADHSHDTENPRDSRINVNKADDMDYWTNKLKAPAQMILTAVKTVGPRVEDVKEWLKNNGYPNSSL